MKKLFLFALICLCLSTATVWANITLPYLKVGESYPNTTAYVLTAQEQLSGQAFQQDALISYNGYQYTVYYNATRNVTIARRKLPLGEWKEVVLTHQNTADDAHNVITMGICKNDGTIHLAYDHHNTTLQYSHSVVNMANDPENIAWTTSNFSTTSSEMVTGVTVYDVTYPRFINKPDGNMLFECRFGLSGNGDSYLREYDGATHKWLFIGRYVQGMNASPNNCAYINRMDYDCFGRLHVSWCWRDDYGGGSNHDLCYAYSDDHGRTWKDTHDTVVAQTENITPAWLYTAGACLNTSKPTLYIETIPYYKGYINQESQCTDSKGRVHILNSYMVDGTNTDWATSRTLCVLHHHYRDTAGIWHHNLIRKNGVNVNSYCRSQIILDANDNAYVIANGAEIFAATSANNYTDWDLLTDTDLGRFCSEPQVDHQAIQEGILSFVYLGRDRRIAVLDYLIDYPKPSAGAGLHADYFSDTDYAVKTTSTDNALLSTPRPAGTQSVRWSGTLETHFGEVYQLHLTTTTAAVVYLNGVKVVETGAVSGSVTFDFQLPSINSHKNNIVVEAAATPSDSLSLAWSGNRTPLTVIPVSAFYSEILDQANIVTQKPALECQLTLDTLLWGERIFNASDTCDILSLPFHPAGSYSLEVEAEITDISSGRGMDIEARNSSGRGFRVVLDKQSFHWAAPFSGPYPEIPFICIGTSIL
jgi:hypothetical protein